MLKKLTQFIFFIYFFITFGISSTIQRDTALIYYDWGVADYSRYEKFFKSRNYRVQSVKADDLIKEDWIENCERKILVMPGGADRPYHAKLKGTGCNNIKKFVSEGGIYLGFCAGSYFGCAKIEFAKGKPIEVIEDRELRFFPGLARGPALKDYEYATGKGASLAIVQLNTGEIVQINHNGGPFFVIPTLSNPDVESVAIYKDGKFVIEDSTYPNIEVLATYQSNKSRFQNKKYDGLPAIVRCPYGKGFAILTGVHFEETYNYLTSEKEEKHPIWAESFFQFLNKILPIVK